MSIVNLILEKNYTLLLVQYQELLIAITMQYSLLYYHNHSYSSIYYTTITKSTTLTNRFSKANYICTNRCVYNRFDILNHINS